MRTLSETVVTLPGELDPTLTARLCARTPLRYAEGGDATLDRPAHVRSGSALAWWGGRLAVVQDDAHFIALCEPSSLDVRALTLPAGAGGLRQFDDARGNKHEKLDLEACLTVPAHEAAPLLDALGLAERTLGGPVLLAFGSGSTRARERVVVATLEGATAVVDAPGLYEMLRAREDFAGSELNVEGIVRLDAPTGPVVRLLQRGNGAPRGALTPVDATGELALGGLLAHLARPDAAPVPTLERVRRYELGRVDDARLTFTDAAERDGVVCFLAAAEASPDAVNDGPVRGVAVGYFDATGAARYALLRDVRGELVTAKAEGLARAPGLGRFYAVVDRDDPAAPAELLELECGGAWPWAPR